VATGVDQDAVVGAEADGQQGKVVGVDGGDQWLAVLAGLGVDLG
jgi:hypothetical protein